MNLHSELCQPKLVGLEKCTNTPTATLHSRFVNYIWLHAQFNAITYLLASKVETTRNVCIFCTTSIVAALYRLIPSCHVPALFIIYGHVFLYPKWGQSLKLIDRLSTSYFFSGCLLPGPITPLSVGTCAKEFLVVLSQWRVCCSVAEADCGRRAAGRHARRHAPRHALARCVYAFKIA